ncbi:MAG: hypothetical protein Q9202_007385 [Teloschistes flavicans]
MCILSLSQRTSIVLAIASLFRSSWAEIVGCDAVDCPRDKYNETQCVIGNTTARAVGISSFNNELLSAQPLTWTVAIQALDDQQTIIERDFFLGVAPSTNLQTTNLSHVEACSIFYEGVTNRLSFPGLDPENDSGTCNDALSAACVDDLRKQSQDELISIVRDQDLGVSSSSSNQSICGRLANTLQDHAPASCSIATNGNWGSIQARSITNFTAAVPVPQGNCHPTTGADYNLFSIEADRFNVSGQSPRELQLLLFGVTPVLTVVYGSNATDVEIDLSCLKTIGSKAMNTTHRTSSASLPGFGFVVTALPAIMMLSVFLL